MANTRLMPFRDYDEHDVVNLFAFGDTAVTLDSTTTVHAGSVVKIKTGWTNSAEMQMLGDAGASYDNVVSQRYGVNAEVEYANGGSETLLGITLYDVREYDENGELLKFKPQKAAELQAAISGQAVPVATKGTFLFATGAFTTLAGGTISAGDTLYASGNGQITNTAAENSSIGKALGGFDDDGSVLVKVEL
jgi:hypothetical protein|tara:strand:- start:2409 stop:2984 length:576 start_codon:yes stop_codon:yes gene_type:complete